MVIKRLLLQHFYFYTSPVYLRCAALNVQRKADQPYKRLLLRFNIYRTRRLIFLLSCSYRSSVHLYRNMEVYITERPYSSLACILFMPIFINKFYWIWYNKNARIVLLPNKLGTALYLQRDVQK